MNGDLNKKIQERIGGRRKLRKGDRAVCYFGRKTMRFSKIRVKIRVPPPTMRGKAAVVLLSHSNTENG